MEFQTIAIHPAAPAKPAVGAACNGCGVCCLAEPCPVGQMLTLRRRGACRMLRWDEAAAIYRCGLLAGEGWRSGPLGRWIAARARRWIAAGRGCDSDATVS
ncbi:MAG TPA: hypothetical protein VJM48_13165 [Methylibium sp.]|nr:hypothetical protein [Methylibium sp.]